MGLGCRSELLLLLLAGHRPVRAQQQGLPLDEHTEGPVWVLLTEPVKMPVLRVKALLCLQAVDWFYYQAVEAFVSTWTLLVEGGPWEGLQPLPHSPLCALGATQSSPSVHCLLLHLCSPGTLLLSQLPPGSPAGAEQCPQVKPVMEGRSSSFCCRFKDQGSSAGTHRGGLSWGRASCWHCCQGLWLSGWNSLKGKLQSWPTFLCFKLERLNTGGWKI